MYLQTQRHPPIYNSHTFLLLLSIPLFIPRSPQQIQNLCCHSNSCRLQKNHFFSCVPSDIQWMLFWCGNKQTSQGGEKEEKKKREERLVLAEQPCRKRRGGIRGGNAWWPDRQPVSQREKGWDRKQTQIPRHSCRYIKHQPAKQTKSKQRKARQGRANTRRQTETHRGWPSETGQHVKQVAGRDETDMCHHGNTETRARERWRKVAEMVVRGGGAGGGGRGGVIRERWEACCPHGDANGGILRPTRTNTTLRSPARLRPAPVSRQRWSPLDLLNLPLCGQLVRSLWWRRHVAVEKPWWMV